jgi:hypothetical protein
MPISPELVLAWMLRVAPESGARARPIAEGIATAANEDERPLDAAATLVAVGFYESRFDLYAVSPASDPAETVGVYQVWTKWLLFPASPEHQAKTALWLLRDSQRRCHSLAQYVSGRCDAGLWEAHRREMLASKLEFPEFLEPREGPLLKRRREGEL